MKKIIFILVLFSTLGCSENDFAETRISIETDKEQYSIGDEIEITFKIYPLSEKKIIRFHKSYEDIKFSFFSKQEKSAYEEELITTFVEAPSSQDEKTNFKEFEITKEKPFEKILKGRITKFKNKVVFEIPELMVSDSINITSLKRDKNVTLKSFCDSFYGKSNDFELTEFYVIL